MGWVHDGRAKAKVPGHYCSLPNSAYPPATEQAWQCDMCQARWVYRGNYTISRYDLRGQSYLEMMPLWEMLPHIEWPPASVEAAETYLEAAGGKG